jgi:hypothetical protein
MDGRFKKQLAIMGKQVIKVLRIEILRAFFLWQWGLTGTVLTHPYIRPTGWGCHVSEIEFYLRRLVH